MAVMAPHCPEFAILDPVRGGSRKDGLESESLRAGVRSAVAYAAYRHPSEVRLPDFRLLPPNMPDSDFVVPESYFISFDINFSFCGVSEKLLIKTYQFESRFFQGLQAFAAFSNASMYLLSLEEVLDAETSEEQLAPASSKLSEDANGNNELRSVFSQIWWLFWLLLALLLTAVCYMRVLKWRRKRAMRKCVDQEAPAGDSYPENPSWANGSVGVAMYAFDPSEIGPQCGIETGGDCLALTAGDVVHVLASGGGWLYGNQIATGLYGYFPENRIQFAGTPIAGSAAAHQAEVALEQQVDGSGGNGGVELGPESPGRLQSTEAEDPPPRPPDEEPPTYPAVPEFPPSISDVRPGAPIVLGRPQVLSMAGIHAGAPAA